MNKLNIETIKIRNWFWNYTNRSGATNGITEKIGIKTEDYNSVMDILKNISTIPFIEGKKVYFHDSVIFSRSKFREIFPDNKITYKINNADLVIIDKDSILSKYDITTSYKQKLGSSAHPFLYKTNDGEDVLCDNNDSRNVFLFRPVEPAGSIIYLEHSYTGKGTITVKDVDSINELLDNIDKLSSVDSIDLKSEIMLEQESYNMLDKLLSSKMDANLQLAVTMLTGFDYNSSKQRIACLLFKHWDAWNGFYEKRIHIGLKTMFVRLYKEFPHILGNDYGVRNKNAFWFNLLSLYFKDPIIEEEFSNWFKSYIDCPCDNLEVVVKVKDEPLEFSTNIIPKDFSDISSFVKIEADEYINELISEEEENENIYKEDCSPF